MILNEYGKQLLDLCQAARLRILNGRTGHDRNLGKFTCHTACISSVVDYVIVSAAFRPLISEFIVKDLSLHSDHCPLWFSIDDVTSATFRLHGISNATMDMLKDSIDRSDSYTHEDVSSSFSHSKHSFILQNDLKIKCSPL